MKLDRHIVKIKTIKTATKESPASISMEEGFSFVWELTEEVFALSGRHDVKSRLQRHAVTVIRKKG